MNIDDSTETTGQMLLEDIRRIFTTRSVDRLASSVLTEDLTKLEERPWCEWRKGNPMTQNTLSKLLKDFGVKSIQMRFGTENLKGYKLKGKLSEAFDRYLPPIETDEESSE